ncbi:Dabb family protein [Nitratireductor aquimarinus]|uniref:Dabb family protein n=1 Tax=Nitratireductor aquimarinus TaxID=889300 RepID=A0ABU4AEY6_9HYPH|nr:MULTISPECIES: Dabb family protein [Alphaproteobacteria]MBN7763634.1 Dabb family protein [Nitratireductor aquibiodomus]MBN7774640.1 Dabb family protein [Nitratireductor pacificus]MBY6023732.1 Dabb family protein [Nitratireductor sp. DP7N14-4]MBN7758682.1 Dabb family protein [Nitratireductor aquimarinus]MBN7779501.1 Dabb family protein [Nitratireductor pacificus]
MIRHIVFFSAKDEADVERIAEGLGMLAEIPHSDFFEIGINRKVDQIGTEVDVIVYGEFRDEAALAAYKAHPVYDACTAKVRPMREIRMAADFVSKKKD